LIISHIYSFNKFILFQKLLNILIILNKVKIEFKINFTLIIVEYHE